MIKKKVLIFASYPIENPQHGGQKRVKAIVDFYKTIFSEVKFVGIYHKDFYHDFGEDDIFIGQSDIVEASYLTPYFSDIIAGKAIDTDIHVRSPVAKMLSDFKPDIVQVEQVFPYFGLKVLLKELAIKTMLIYSSQNIEYIMKEHIYTTLSVPPSVSQPAINEIKRMEEALSRDADLVIAVSNEDAKILKNDMGAKRCVVASNGIDKVVSSAASRSYWDNFKRQHGIKYAITFIASGHPPNWTGFLEMVGDKMEYLPKDAKVLLVGGVAEHFQQVYKSDKDEDKLFWNKAIAVGRVSEEHLNGLLAKSDLIVLPITSGGGSNLKTAEAIISGRKVVATSYSFRSYDAYQKLPNIYIASTPEEFKKLMVKAIHAPYIERNDEQRHQADRVKWQYSLAPLYPELRRIARSATRRKMIKKTKTVLRKTGATKLVRRVVKKRDSNV